MPSVVPHFMLDNQGANMQATIVVPEFTTGDGIAIAD